MATTNSTLYSRDFGSRPVFVLGGGIVLGALLAGVAISIGIPLLAIIAVLPIAGGIAGFLTATTHLDVTAGQVTRRSRLRETSYDAATLSIERRGASNMFVIAPSEQDRKVLCTFEDADTDRVRGAFTAAGVTYVESAPAPAPESQPESEQSTAS